MPLQQTTPFIDLSAISRGFSLARGLAGEAGAQKGFCRDQGAGFGEPAALLAMDLRCLRKARLPSCFLVGTSIYDDSVAPRFL